MAFMILSAGKVASSQARTIRFGSFVAVMVLLVALMFGGGVLLGMWLQPYADTEPVLEDDTLNAATDFPPAPTLVIDAPGDRVLIGRMGELAGRVIQLEAEAAALAGRIEAIQDFETRIGEVDFDELKGRLARTPPGPAGGPLLAPRSEVERGTPAKGFLGLKLELDTPVFEGSQPLDQQVSAIAADMDRLAEVLDELDRIAGNFNLAHLSFPGRSPVLGFRMNSSFGNRVDPINRKRAFHSGVDYAAPRGTPIYASAGGKVIYAGRRAFYGNTVEIDHGAGLVSRYAHAHKLHVKTGQVVMPHDKIAEVGSTGRSTGAHLHFEILKDGHFVDPRLYLTRF